jgi:hypothetical protein
MLVTSCRDKTQFELVRILVTVAVGNATKAAKVAFVAHQLLFFSPFLVFLMQI